MKLDRQKYDLAKARACKGQKELMAEGIPKGTLCRAAGGYSLKPETAGKYIIFWSHGEMILK